MKKTLTFILAAVLLFAPATIAFAQGGLLPDCGYEGNECGFYDLITLARNVINFLIILSVVLATAAFAYAGLILMTSGGNTSKKEDAKKILKKVLIGFLWILGAWLLVYTISSALLKDNYFFTP